LQARLGTGDIGRVYLAAAPKGRVVAVKVMHEHFCGDPAFRARFTQEVQAGRRVPGRYTAELLAADPYATRPWLVTAFVAGPSLADVIIGAGPLPAGMLPGLVAGMAGALQAIHTAGLVHRGLKPSHVLLGPDGPQVIDFGTAADLRDTSTWSSASVHYPPFMAPEQIRALPATPATDVFSLGSLAACALLGRSPFGHDDTAAVMHRILREPPDLAGCPVGLRAIIESCLAKEPQARPLLPQIIDRCQALDAPSPEPPSRQLSRWLRYLHGGLGRARRA
jgi:serine/threonine protein kinase